MIHLVLLSPSAGDGGAARPTVWPLGPVHRVAPSASEIHRLIDGIDTETDAEADTPGDRLLFWHEDLGSTQRVRRWIEEELPTACGEIFHAGLRLGQGGRPAMMDFVHPTWMLQRDPVLDRSASSWRVSLRACLVPVSLWRAAGGLDAGFDDLDAAALELGRRWWRLGALLRHEPSWLDGSPSLPEVQVLSAADELRFIRRSSGRFWSLWAALRAGLVGDHSPSALVGAWRSLAGVGAAKIGPQLPEAPLPEAPTVPEDVSGARVGVLIPTLDRYPYLKVVLDQLQNQTIPPHRVVVVDQTDPERRRRDWHSAFPRLPLEVIEQDRRGQSTARNAGLRRLDVERILFLDDDVEIESDLIARHLAVLEHFRADVSCGVTEETGAGPLPEDFRRRRLSDVFPTCNCMIRRAVLECSGFFDLAFDFGPRADADLGSRIYQSGALMVLAPSISVLHHKAPAGGLRRHKARVVTYAQSRRSLWARHLPHATEIYLARRYFTARQVKESLLLRWAGTLRGKGSLFQQGLKLLVGLLQAPHTCRRIGRADRDARELARTFPQIPFPEPDAEVSS